MKKLLILWMWMAVPGALFAQSLQTCLWPNPCGSNLSQDKDRPLSKQMDILRDQVQKLTVSNEIRLPYFIPLPLIAENPEEYLGKRIQTRGILIHPCIHYAANCFYIQDMERPEVLVPVSPWLPLEVLYIRPPVEGQAYAMSELIGKPLEINSQLVRQDKDGESIYLLQVEDHHILP